ncbi:macro domain-containing protein VPA0103 [Ricinus communis]|uniref:Protein LRP16, putative n=1 Tax=Ricinus communis TaxID=3988 RepID=B9S4E3_RICCO|nr:macro domain-containing protein VPA0103 [Ricinus communis]EEF41571.1 Protein LRP16, putative [Ricinus communis]|eukprot:XP_002520862.1 uncharacterized protein LOC8259546 [Ricinus communis]
MATLCRSLVLVRARLSSLSPTILVSTSTFTSLETSIPLYSINQPYSRKQIPKKYLKNHIPLTSSHIMASSAGLSTNGGDTDINTAVFPLSSSSVLKINKGDITKWFVDGSSDAIVNPANEKMLGGGGADGAIHRAAGPELVDACYKVPEVRPGIRCPTGEARITPGFKLPASHVIHTVGPIYDANRNSAAILKNAYRNSLSVAKDNNIKFIAFPAISCGVYLYPFEEAASVSISTIKEFADDIKEVHFVLFSDEIFNVWVKKAKELLLA